MIWMQRIMFCFPDSLLKLTSKAYSTSLSPFLYIYIYRERERYLILYYNTFIGNQGELGHYHQA